MSQPKSLRDDRPARSERATSTMISGFRWDQYGLWLIGVVAAAVLLYFAGRVFLLAFAGVLLAVLLNSMSEWVSRNSSLSYRYAFAVVVAGLVVLGGISIWRLQDIVVQQMQEFVRVFPESISSVRDRMEGIHLGNWVPQKVPTASAIAEQPQMWSSVTGLASGTLTFAVEALVILFVGLYGAAEPRLYQHGIRLLVPPPHRSRADHVLYSLGCALRWWMLGKICSMTIVGVAVGIGLWLLGVKFALLLGLAAGVLELIPNFGPILASLPAILIAWSQSSQTALYVTLLYGIVQLAESYLILPLIQRKVIESPPAMVILAVVLMAMLAGTLGVLVATPLLAVTIVLVKMLYIEDYLGDQSVEVIGDPASE